jgi:hypothetical protein
MGERQGKRRRGAGRRQGNEFMDVAREAFIRYVALEKWREIEDMRQTLGFDWTRAAGEVGHFVERGRYRRLWIQRWEAQVLPEAAGADAGRFFAAIERAVADAVSDEEEARKLGDARPLAEDFEYKAFVDACLEGLLRAQAEEQGPTSDGR